MALPEKVIERLSREPAETPGWSLGLLVFSGGILLFALVVYFGLTLGYEPYLNGQVATLNGQLNTLARSVSSDDQAKLVTFFSEITNLKTILNNHVVFSRFLTWLEQNTEANVYYTNLSFSSNNLVSLTVMASSESDVNQQIAIFEAAPAVKSATFSGVSNSNTAGKWQFTAALTMDPAAVLRTSK